MMSDTASCPVYEQLRQQYDSALESWNTCEKLEVRAYIPAIRRQDAQPRKKQKAKRNEFIKGMFDHKLVCPVCRVVSPLPEQTRFSDSGHDW
jgi:hypothetical protein